MTVAVSAIPRLAATAHDAPRRLAVLLGVALASGLLAAWAGNATAGKAVAHRPVSEPRDVPARLAGTCPLPATLRPAFVRAARDTALPLSMLVAVGKVESNLKVDARSAAGARGLLQLLPS